MIPLSLAQASPIAPPAWLVIPFCLLLLSVATLPLLAGHFWEHHYKKVATGLGLGTAACYYGVTGSLIPILHSIQEYISFIALVGSLFVISGGINIRVKGESTPWKNVAFLLVGAIASNIIGTTGASMLLIRPWIQMNKYRITSYHVVFFIFIVSNVGGCLTPIGDPPLFLGFLRGVSFWWVFLHGWPYWLCAIGLLLTVFYAIDHQNFHRAPQQVQDLVEHEHELWRFRGLRNVWWLGVVLGAMLMPPSWRIGNETFAIPVGAIVMAAAALMSYKITPPTVHESNDFSFGPVQEVAWLFVGIFLTMRPALDILQSGNGLTIVTPLQYYFASGALSAFLDNAPTYLAFLAAAMGKLHLSVDDPAQVAQFATQQSAFVLAVSLGAVFFGAGSYIGNGPNFMVKAIAHKAHVKTPSFPGYIVKYSLPILLPILIVVGLLALSGRR
jgi:Na+/H+ antiporter NhaD/arsenite permease-like protein